MVVVKVSWNRWRWAVASVLVVALGVAYAGRVQASAPAPAPGYAAVDLADAVLFADGPAAKHLAELERPPIEWTEEAKRSRDAIDKAVAGDQRWADSFAERIQSGDPNRITTALHDLGVRARLAMDDLWGKDTMDKAVDELVGGVRGQVLVWQRYVIIHRIFMVVRYVFIIWAADLKDRFETGNLPDELTVRTIAENLAARA